MKPPKILKADILQTLREQRYAAMREAKQKAGKKKVKSKA